MVSKQEESKIHSEILKEAIDDNNTQSVSRIIFILIGILLSVLIILMIIPYTSINLDPHPTNIPNYSIVSSFNFDKINYTSNISNIWSLLDYDPSIKLFSDRIALQSCPNSGDICNAKAMFYFVRDSIMYVKDPTYGEYIKHPQTTLISGSGDCDDKAVLLVSMLRSVGINARFVYLPRHLAVEALLPFASSRYKDNTDWVYLDPTCNNCDFGEKG